MKIPTIKKPLDLLRIYLARQYAKLYTSEMFIGITGSVGKTTTVAASVAVLSQKYKTISTQPNLDPILNVPSTLLKLNPSIKKVILELGVEYKGEMDFYLSLVKFKTAIVTKIAHSNSEYLGGLDEILLEKGKLIQSLPEDGIAILNFDDANSRGLEKMCKGTIIYYGTSSQNCSLWAGNIRTENFRTSFELNFGVERVKINYQLLGTHQVYSALAAATLGITCGVPLTKIKHGLESIESSEFCLQPLLGPNGSIILDDTYNSSPAAVEAAFDTLLEIPARRKVIVLGEMQKLGEYSDILHRQIAQRIYKEKFDLVFLGQGDTQIIADELKSLGFWEERLEVNLQTGQLVGKLLKTLGKGDVCLIKGSRAVRLDEVVKRIIKK